MIKINMYGDGVRVWLCHVKKDLLLRMDEARKHLPWEFVLFDLEFLNHFGFDHWSQLSPKKEQLGFYLTEKNIIEIKQGNKKLSRFYSSELTENNLLFPIYNTIESIIEKESSFILIEKETGLIMSYSINAEKIQMDDLLFHISPLQNKLILSTISYRNTNLIVSKTDTVVRSVECYKFS
jgi:hypothetical protein